MVAGVEIGVDAASVLPVAGAGFELGKGAIIGAMLVGAAFLAGTAVLRKSAAACCGLLMLAAGGALQLVWLGVVAAPTSTIFHLLEGIFAASALIFLSATIGMAGRNQVVGGLLFAGALSMAGVGVINAVLSGQAAGLLNLGLALVAVTVLGLSAIAGARGDVAARLVLPGAALAAAAPLLFGVAPSTGLMALAPQAIFAVGVLTASLVALGAFNAPKPEFGFPTAASSSFSGSERQSDRDDRFSRQNALRVSENQLAQVLDYSGIAVWDWDRSGAHQTESFASLMGADSNSAFTPEAFRAFIQAGDLARFDDKIFGILDGDGGFDEVLKLHNGKTVRMRGARAVDRSGQLERIVVFLDDSAAPQLTPEKDDALRLAAASLTGAAATAAKIPAKGVPEAADSADSHAKASNVPLEPDHSVSVAIERGELIAAFQPIVCFDTGKTCGAEALLRWPAGERNDGKTLTTEEVVREAQRTGKGAALAAIMMKATVDHVAEKVAAGEKDYFGAFNVSLSQVREAGFVDEVRAAIAGKQLPRGALVLELTEGEYLGDAPKINDVFKKLKAAGASLAYDDFGAGFSSLSNLHKYDFDYLKIDKSFIDDIVANGGKKKIVTALAKLGRDFDMTVIAEGVESKDAAEMAKAIGCKMGQGYYLGEPSVRAPSPRVAADDAPAAELSTPANAGADAEAEILVLDRSLEAANAAGGRVRRRLFSKGLR